MTPAGSYTTSPSSPAQEALPRAEPSPPGMGHSAPSPCPQRQCSKGLTAVPQHRVQGQLGRGLSPSSLPRTAMAAPTCCLVPCCSYSACIISVRKPSNLMDVEPRLRQTHSQWASGPGFEPCWRPARPAYPAQQPLSGRVRVHMLFGGLLGATSVPVSSPIWCGLGGVGGDLNKLTL